MQYIAISIIISDILVQKGILLLSADTAGSIHVKPLYAKMNFNLPCFGTHLITFKTFKVIQNPDLSPPPVSEKRRDFPNLNFYDALCIVAYVE